MFPGRVTCSAEPRARSLFNTCILPAFSYKLTFRSVFHYYPLYNTSRASRPHIVAMCYGPINIVLCYCGAGCAVLVSRGKILPCFYWRVVYWRVFVGAGAGNAWQFLGNEKLRRRWDSWVCDVGVWHV